MKAEVSKSAYNGRLYLLLHIHPSFPFLDCFVHSPILKRIGAWVDCVDIKGEGRPHRQVILQLFKGSFEMTVCFGLELYRQHHGPLASSSIADVEAVLDSYYKGKSILLNEALTTPAHASMCVCSAELALN